MPRVSILMPCYNAAGHLPRALEGLFQQTLQDFEIVAVDDGSTDDTPRILRAGADRDRRLRVISRPHLGIVEALQAGLQSCKAPLVARMDADDFSRPTRLDRQVAYLESNPGVCVVGCLVQAVPPSRVREGFQIYLSWLNRLVEDADIRREMFIESPLVHPSVMFRRDRVLAAGGYQEHGWPEDYDLWLRLYLAEERFGKVPQTLVNWTERPDRLTRTDPRYSVENFLRAKAHYLARGPLANRETVLIWGAGMMGRRLSKHLLRAGVSLEAFIDIDPRKIGRTRRGRPILAPEDLPVRWEAARRPALLVAVGARGARPLIRERLSGLGLREGEDWWFCA